MKTNKTLWCDQDGVLARYEHHAYRGNNPLYLQAGKHYFRTLEPDMHIIRAIQNLHENGLSVHVITNISNQHPIWIEQQQDKKEWIQEHLPFIDITHCFHAIQTPKYKAAIQLLQRPLCKDDILISDYNIDLSTWTDAGGTAVKYLNGLNSADSFSGAKLHENLTAMDICACILAQS